MVKDGTRKGWRGPRLHREAGGKAGSSRQGRGRGDRAWGSRAGRGAGGLAGRGGRLSALLTDVMGFPSVINDSHLRAE